jgi:acetylornithine deacetylase/succinyl-diaminopimelate desuccinylase-like protein
MYSTDAVLARLEQAEGAAQERWMNWLRIASISAQPAHAADCRAAAEFCRAELAAMGFAAQLVETEGHPVVLAHHSGPPGENGKRLLYYGHYDVQPPDPLELWQSPPFEPQVVDGPHGKRVVARGAVDDKGQVAMWLAAFRAWHDVAGTMPVPITVLIEGEEEIGSPNLERFVVAHREQLQADGVVVSDTDMWDVATPAICTSLRGLVYLQVDLQAASRDLHSGMFGGAALNPINALTHALGQLHDATGRVALEGFYHGVAEVPAEQAAQWAALGFDEAGFLGGIGLTKPAGEVGRGPLERLWARPTADINGIWGGYTGEGAKTVIPARASAKVSFRLVPGQDPERIAQSFRRFMQARVPADANLAFQSFGASPGMVVALDNPLISAARKSLAEEYGRPAVLIGGGGSIPVVEAFKRLLGLDTLLMGFGLSDDQIHSPNEKFEVVCFRHGMRSHARLLGRLGERNR